MPGLLRAMAGSADMRRAASARDVMGVGNNVVVRTCPWKAAKVLETGEASIACARNVHVKWLLPSEQKPFFLLLCM